MVDKSRSDDLNLQRGPRSRQNGSQARESADIKVLRTLAFFSGRRAIDMQVLTDLKRGAFSDVAPRKRNAPPV